MLLDFQLMGFPRCVWRSLSLSLLLSLSLSYYCFARAKEAQVREGGNSSPPSVEDKTGVMPLSSL